MRCPSCQNEISDNQFYCPICRASVYSYTPENARSFGSGSQVGRAGKRLLEVLLLLILICVGVVIGRSIKWNELLNTFLPGLQITPAAKSERGPSPSPSSSSGSAGKHRSPESSKNPSKESVEKPADSAKPAAPDKVRDPKQKTDEVPASGETRPTPKPTPTPKPPSS